MFSESRKKYLFTGYGYTIILISFHNLESLCAKKRSQWPNVLKQYANNIEQKVNMI